MDLATPSLSILSRVVVTTGCLWGLRAIIGQMIHHPRIPTLSYWLTRVVIGIMSVMSLFIMSHGQAKWFRYPGFWNCPPFLSVQLLATDYLIWQFSRFLYELTDISGRMSIIGLLLRRFHVFASALLILLWLAPTIGSRVLLPPTSLLGLMVVFDAVDLLMDTQFLMKLYNVYSPSALISTIWFMNRVVLFGYAIYSGRLGGFIASILWGTVWFLQVLLSLSTYSRSNKT